MPLPGAALPFQRTDASKENDMKGLKSITLVALVFLGSLAGCAQIGNLSTPDTDIYENSLSD